MKDEGLDFLMKDMEESMPEIYGHLGKYTDIDKDILNMETIKKNLLMKDRKLNAEGGRIGYAGGGKAGLPAITQGLPQGPGMQQPQMPVGPQPTGIPGGTIVAQNQMQQNPMGQNPMMKQGIGGPRPGGMPRPGGPRPGGMPRPMAAEGGRMPLAEGKSRDLKNKNYGYYKSINNIWKIGKKKNTKDLLFKKEWVKAQDPF